MIKSKNIQLFESLTQKEYGGEYFDFHNNFDCLKIFLTSTNEFIILFKSLINDEEIKMRFNNVLIKKILFFNSNQVENLTIDNIYRGKALNKNKLIEFDNDKGYFYLEFYEGQNIEFWASSLTVEL